MNPRIGVARVVFALGALQGVLSAGAGALYGAAYSSGNIGVTFLAIWVPIGALWVLFCYGGYRGLESDKVVLRILFWMFVLAHLLIFPIGTAIGGTSIWLWRDVRRITR